MSEVKTKKRKVSKKTKNSWRKHIDIKDVDAFLDKKRLEERLGIFSERPDSDFFTIENFPKKAPVSKYVARLALKNKEPTCFANLKPHTQVPDPISKRNRVRPKEERTSSLKNRTLAKSANLYKRGDFQANLWDVTSNALPEVVTEWMSSDGIRHTVKHLGIEKRKLPSSLHKKTSIVPAIEAPHPGTSYNPSYTDHQQLLQEVGQQELEIMKQEAHLNRVTNKMFKKVSLDTKNKDLMKEMSEGLIKNNETTTNLESGQDTEEDNEEGKNSTIIAKHKAVKNVKKTLIQKRKQHEQKEAAKESLIVKLQKKKISDIYKLKILQKQIEAKEKKEEILRQKRLKKQKRESTMPKILSKMKFEPLDPDFQTSDELSGNLRNCSFVNGVLKDRYKSLQQRNIIAPAVIKLKRDKAKVKKFLKPDHKINV